MMAYQPYLASDLFLLSPWTKNGFYIFQLFLKDQKNNIS